MFLASFGWRVEARLKITAGSNREKEERSVQKSKFKKEDYTKTKNHLNT